MNIRERACPSTCAYFETLEELRLPHSEPTNAGLLPYEVELVQRIDALEEQARLAHKRGSVPVRGPEHPNPAPQS